MSLSTDRQVRRLRALLKSGKSLKAASMRADMDEKTARKYREAGKLPSELEVWPRVWRTRKDPFADVWNEVREQLEASPGLQAKTLFEWLQRTYPGRFEDGQLRSLQRRLRQWRATAGPAKEVFFAQVHHPGRLAASDFTHMGSLGVTLGGQPFDHMVYHFVLTYSNWETVSICFSESFESLSEGLQQALWELGGVPERHRSDRMSAAVNNLSERKEFTRRYQALTAHYGLTMEKINPRKAHENGDAEQSHHRFKQAVDQALLLRGTRDFPARAAYERFLREVLEQRNSGRGKHLAEEKAALRPLPSGRQESYKRARGPGPAREPDSCGTERVFGGQPIDRRAGRRAPVRGPSGGLVRGRVVECHGRLRGQRKHIIHYRHVIDWLVRKPGAFENYQYRDDLFPTSRFRMEVGIFLPMRLVVDSPPVRQD